MNKELVFGAVSLTALVVLCLSALHMGDYYFLCTLSQQNTPFVINDKLTPQQQLLKGVLDNTSERLGASAFVLSGLIPNHIIGLDKDNRFIVTTQSPNVNILLDCQPQDDPLFLQTLTLRAKQFTMLQKLDEQSQIYSADDSTTGIWVKYDLRDVGQISAQNGGRN